MLALGLGLAGCVQLRRWGVPTTYVRDLLHVGAGVWVLGWPFWHHWIPPAASSAGSGLVIAMGPALARRSPAPATCRHSGAAPYERRLGHAMLNLPRAVHTTRAR